DTEDIAEIVTAVPRPEQFLDAVELDPPVQQPADRAHPIEVIGAVIACPPLDLRWGKNPSFVINPQAAHGRTGGARQLIDRVLHTSSHITRKPHRNGNEPGWTRPKRPLQPALVKDSSIRRPPSGGTLGMGTSFISRHSAPDSVRFPYCQRVTTTIVQYRTGVADLLRAPHPGGASPATF